MFWGEYTIMIIIPKNEPESKEKQTVGTTLWCLLKFSYSNR